MKRQILEIADKLRENQISADEAQSLLLGLFGVINSTKKQCHNAPNGCKQMINTSYHDCNMCDVYY